MKLANRLCKDTKVNLFTLLASGIQRSIEPFAVKQSQQSTNTTEDSEHLICTSSSSLPVRYHQEDSENQTTITNKEMQEKFDSQKQTTLKRQSEYFQVCSALGLDAF